MVIHRGDSIFLDIDPAEIRRVMVIPPSIGTLRNGYFVARKKGDGVIKVVFKNRPPSYSYVKVTGRRFKIEISPRKVELNPGDTIQFKLKTPQGRPCFIHWRVVPSWIGKISLTGEFVAGKRSGRGKVISVVKCRGRKGIGFANISVGNSSRFVSVKILPDPVYADGKIKLRITPEINGLDSIDWIVEPEKLGFVNENQEFVPLRPHGRGVVWFTAWKNRTTYTGKTLVFVGKPPEFVTPERFVVLPGDTTVIKVRLPGRLKRRIYGFQWAVKPEWLGRFIETSAFPVTHFIAGGNSGVGMIFLKLNGRPLNFTRTPIIVGKTAVSIVPSSAYLKIGETKKFRIDKKVKGIWRVFPEFAGRIDEDGNFTAEVPLREVFIIFEVTEPGGGGGIARVTIVPVD